MLKRFLFSSRANDNFTSAMLLVVRIFFGLLLMSHGITKLMHYQELSMNFPDPLGVGSSVSLGLAIFGELVCSLGFVVGFLYRLVMIPMIFTMFVVVFMVLAHSPFSAKELPFVYLVVFILMYIMGPGKFAIDHWISKLITSPKSN